jgi:hypothetical protein
MQRSVALCVVEQWTSWTSCASRQTGQVKEGIIFICDIL